MTTLEIVNKFLMYHDHPAFQAAVTYGNRRSGNPDVLLNALLQCLPEKRARIAAWTPFVPRGAYVAAHYCIPLDVCVASRNESAIQLPHNDWKLNNDGATMGDFFSTVHPGKYDHRTFPGKYKQSIAREGSRHIYVKYTDIADSQYYVAYTFTVNEFAELTEYGYNTKEGSGYTSFANGHRVFKYNRNCSGITSVRYDINGQAVATYVRGILTEAAINGTVHTADSSNTDSRGRITVDGCKYEFYRASQKWIAVKITIIV